MTLHLMARDLTPRDHGSQHMAQRPRSASRRLATATAVLVQAFITSTAWSDTITFSGTGIAMRGCTIQAVQGGQVSYTDASGQRQRRPIEQVEALGFDGLPDLDLAEAALADQNLNDGEWALLRALLKADNDVQRLWIHARLSHVHDLRGEYVQAAGHAAEVFAISDDVTWKSLRPVSPVNAPGYAAAHEALDSLQAAAKRVKSAELQREIETMTRLVQGVHDKLSADYKGPPIARNSTVSGYPRETVLARDRRPSDAELAVGATPQPTTSTTAPVAPVHAPTPVPLAQEADSSDPRSAGAIDRLLASGRGSDAAALCAEIEKNPGERDLGHFLFQYGKALTLAGRRGEAAIMFTRCAILFPDSADAGPSLIETATIYRDEFRKPETARRLLQLAIANAERDNQQAVAMLAREILDTLGNP